MLLRKEIPLAGKRPTQQIISQDNEQSNWQHRDSETNRWLLQQHDPPLKMLSFNIEKHYYDAE